MGGKRGYGGASHDVAPCVSSSYTSGLEETNSVARKRRRSSHLKAFWRDVLMQEILLAQRVDGSYL